MSATEGELRKSSAQRKRKGPPKRALHPATEATGGTGVRLCPPLTTTTAAPEGTQRSGREIQATARQAPNTVGSVMGARVRLDKETRLLLERIAPEFGGREATVGEALRRLAADHDRKQALSDFLEAWEAEAGPLSPDEVSALAERHGL